MQIGTHCQGPSVLNPRTHRRARALQALPASRVSSAVFCGSPQEASASQPALPATPCQRLLSSGPGRPCWSRASPSSVVGHRVAATRLQAQRDTAEGTTTSQKEVSTDRTLLERQLSGSEASTSTEPASPSTNGMPVSAAKVAQEKELIALNALPVKEQSYEAIAAWVGAAMAFGGGIWYTQGPEKAQEYFAGYLLEQSLSVDNLFVFILVFNYFKTPVEAQSKVLTWGIATAAVLRAVFIVAGVELIDSFQPLLVLFAAILIYSSYKIFIAGDEDDDDEDLADNAVVKFCRRFIPTTEHYDGDKFWTVNNGERVATPLLLTLAVVELSDVLFAIDSIPAVFGVTLDPFIIYTSNIFAILSLRALYSFVSNIMSELRFLDKSVAIVLGFIGVKMLLGFTDVDIPTDISLLTVGVVLGGGVAASLLLPEPAEAD